MALPEHSISLLDKKNLTGDVSELIFTKPRDFSFVAGQFVQCLIPEGDILSPRSYSLASTPNDDTLIICAKLFPNGLASNHFKKMDIGDSLTIRGPLGKFVCTEDATSHFFIATGVGVAPIMSMIEDELKNKKTDKEIHLLFGLRFEENLFWMEKLDALASSFDRFSYRLTLSRPKENWSGLSGRVTDHLKEHTTTHDFYLCGSANMVKDVRALLLASSVPPKQIHFEIF